MIIMDERITSMYNELCMMQQKLMSQNRYLSLITTEMNQQAYKELMISCELIEQFLKISHRYYNT